MVPSKTSPAAPSASPSRAARPRSASPLHSAPGASCSECPSVSPPPPSPSGTGKELHACSTTKIGHSFDHQCNSCSASDSDEKSWSRTSSDARRLNQSSKSGPTGGVSKRRRTTSKSATGHTTTPAPRVRFTSFSTTTSSCETSKSSLILGARPCVYSRGYATCFGRRNSKPLFANTSWVTFLLSTRRPRLRALHESLLNTRS
mmetsp:Transcript_65647/g.201156  ORF Transcript_65647/g.201156 Transcript_65647/m.201156 type:complete len:203 (-) Transcript_65647:522-1130(-)